MVLDKDEVQSAQAAGPMLEKRGTVLCFLPGNNSITFIIYPFLFLKLLNIKKRAYFLFIYLFIYFTTVYSGWPLQQNLYYNDGKDHC